MCSSNMACRASNHNDDINSNNKKLLSEAAPAGSVCVWRFHTSHNTSHPSVERLGSGLWSRQHSNRGSSACLQEGICSVWLRSHGYFAADCSWRTSAADIDTTAEELQEIGHVAGILSWLGSGEPVRTALNRVLGGGQPLLRDVAILPDRLVSGHRSQPFGFRRAKHSATLPLQKLGMSRWCGVSHDHIKTSKSRASVDIEPTWEQVSAHMVIALFGLPWEREELPITLLRLGTPCVQRASLSHRLLG